VRRPARTLSPRKPRCRLLSDMSPARDEWARSGERRRGVCAPRVCGGHVITKHTAVHRQRGQRRLSRRSCAIPTAIWLRASLDHPPRSN